MSVDSSPSAPAVRIPPTSSGEPARRWSVRRWRALEQLTSHPAEPVSPTVRLVLSAGTLVLLLVSVVAALTGARAVLAVAVSVSFVIGLGIAPALSARLPGASAVVIVAAALSTSIAMLGGLTMALTGAWHPIGAFLSVAAVSALWSAWHIVRSWRAVTAGLRGRIDTLGAACSVTAALGLVVVVVAAATHRSEPTPGGLLTVVGPWWWLGAALPVAAALVATLTRRSPAVPLLIASVVVVLSQAVVYREPTVMTAARHVGVVQYVRAYHALHASLDIYQAWAGLFAGAAWLCDVGAITDPLSTIATYDPVVLNLGAVLAMRVLAGRLGLTPTRAWWAGAVFVFANTLNTTYFSPQSTGIVLALVIAALALSVPKGWGAVGHVAILLVISCALAVTHQISPYLLAAALTVLVLMRAVPWWTVVTVLVPALAWAVGHASSLTGYIGLGAFGDVAGNLKPPASTYVAHPQPLITKLVFDIPAAALVVVGLVAVAAALQHRDRRSLALLASAASAGLLAVGSNYGQEAIFRIALFALPWLSLSALTLRWPGAAAPAPSRGLGARVISARMVWCGAVVVLVAVNAFGSTGMDWARVIRVDAAAQSANLESTAPAGSQAWSLGNGDAFPWRVTQHYPRIGGLSEQYGVPGDVLVADPASDARARTLIGTWSRQVASRCPGRCFVVVTDSTAAYNERYGIQDVRAYERYGRAIATSPLWTLYSSGPTTSVYEVRTGAAQ